MSTNLLLLAQQALGNDFSELAGHFLGETPDSTRTALSSLLPTVLGAIANRGTTPEGAARLMALMGGANLDIRPLDDIAGLFGGGWASNGLMRTGVITLVPALFANKSGALVNALSSAAGIKTSSATNLIAMVVPLIFLALRKFIGEKGLSASSLSALLSSQGPSLQGALDSRMTRALGFGSPAAFLSGLRGHVVEASRRVGTTAATSATTGTSGFVNWLPWVVGALALLLLWNIF